MANSEFLEMYRHSMAHILAKAVIELFGKETQYAIGPQIADGFYYDFDLSRPVTEDDYKTIENKMKEIMKRKEDWRREEISRADALELFKDQKYKTELINDLPEDEKITIYYTGDDFVDLCRGPHIENSQELLSAAFKVRSASSAYWRGDEKRDSLTRIYVYAFPTKDELKQHLALIREAKERDHKKIGARQELFMFQDTAPGMPYWLPRGWKMYQRLVSFMRETQDKHGYEEISCPVINNKRLWLVSGHWAHYVNNMFLIPGITKGTKAEDTVAETDGAEVPEGAVAGTGAPAAKGLTDRIVVDYSIEAPDTMAAKPMNCPNAMLTYKRKLRSYKELPIRYSEFDVLHRKEKSGQLNGLFRVQEFRQDDDHTFVMESQIEDEIKDIMNLVDEIYSAFGLTYRAEFSTRPDDFMGDIEVWNKAEASLKKILDETYGEGNYEINEGDGAFYGPKIDLQIKDALGREWQCGTIQLDFQLPANFGLTYTDTDGSFKQPVVIHRAIYGSIERFLGILTEHFKGAFPFWMCPYQVGIVPIVEENNDFAREVASLLEENGIRVEADYSDRNMNEKIKHYRTLGEPIILVIGGKEVESRTVSVTIRGQKKQLHDVPLDKLVEVCRKLNEEHALELDFEA